MEKNVWIGGNGLQGDLKEKTSSSFSFWKEGKFILPLLLFLLFVLRLTLSVHAEGQWANQENGWYYYSDGKEPYTGWIRSAVVLYREGEDADRLGIVEGKMVFSECGRRYGGEAMGR